MIHIFTITGIAVVVAAVLLALLFTPSGRHARYRRRAVRLYDKFNTEPLMGPGQLIGYLRKINPYVFEELILYAFEKKGYRTVRNRRYSGDGGVDGMVWWDGRLCLIQAKRYKHHIDNRHVQDFVNVCSERNMKGFFVHTGRTGKMARNIAAEHPDIEIISGEKLYRLFVQNSQVKTDNYGKHTRTETIS